MQLNRTAAHVLLPGIAIVVTMEDNDAERVQLKRSITSLLASYRRLNDGLNDGLKREAVAKLK